MTEITVDSSTQFNQAYHRIATLLNSDTFDNRRYTSLQLSLPDPNQITDPEHKKIVDHLKKEHDYFVRNGMFVSFWYGYVGPRYDMFVTMTQKLYIVFNMIYSDEYPETGSLFQKQALNTLLIGFLGKMLDHPSLFGKKLWPLYKDFQKSSNTLVTPTGTNQLAIQINSEYVELVNRQAGQIFEANRDLEQRISGLERIFRERAENTGNEIAELRAMIAASRENAIPSTENNSVGYHSFEIGETESQQSLLANLRR